ncbi:MAG: DUF2946 family protein [Burkholderiaceae bacterium]
MFTRRAHRQLTAWLAALALLLGSLLPVLSHAVVRAPADGQGWVEVCTVSGMAWVKDAAQAADDVASGAHTPLGSKPSLDPCGWCATHSPMVGLSAVAQPLFAPLVFGPDTPPAFLHAPRPLFVWAAAQSRAPPASA